MIPGELFIQDGEIELNAGRKTVTLTVANSGDRPIQVGSHYHFFETNPALADDYLAHPHFEVRAVAARYATIFLLPRLLQDPDETVRWCAAQRLPKRYLLPLRMDPHREVRIRIAYQPDSLRGARRSPCPGACDGSPCLESVADDVSPRRVS